MTTRFARVLAAVGASVVIALTASTVATIPAQAASQWQYYEVDADPWYDAASLDADGNGIPEEYWFDLDNDVDKELGGWDTHLWNSVGSDAFHEQLSYDGNEDQRLEAHLYDTDQREGFDAAHYDVDRDGYWDGYDVPYVLAYDALRDMGLSEIRIPGSDLVYNPNQ